MYHLAVDVEQQKEILTPWPIIAVCVAAALIRMIAARGELWLDEVWSLRLVLYHGEFHAQRLSGAVVAGHDEKNARSQVHLGANWNKGRMIAIAESGLDSGNHLSGLEPFTNLVFCEGVHSC